MNDINHLKLLICFCFVGLTGMGVDFLITWAIKDKLKGNKYLASSMGFVSAASFNYLLNRLLTFQSQNPQIIREYTSFIAVSSVGLLISNALLWLLHEKCRITFYYAKGFAIGVTVLWNFFANYYITFSA